MAIYIRSQDEIKIFIDEMDNLILIQRSTDDVHTITISPANIDHFMDVMQLVINDGCVGEENEMV